MKSTVLMLSVAFAVLAATQVLPESLPVSVVQIGLTGGLLVWFVTFSLRRAHAGSAPDQSPSGFSQSG